MSPQKILLIRLSAIGDILLTTPLLRALRTQFPEAQLDFVVKSEFAEILRHHPAINTLYELNVQNGWPELTALGRRLRAARYEVIFDIHNNFRSRYLTHAAKPQRVLRHRKYVLRRWLLVRAKINLLQNTPPIYQRYLEAAAPFNLTAPLSAAGFRLELFWRGEDNQRAEVELSSRQWQPQLPMLGLAPGAGFFTKRWPAEYFGALAVQCIQQGWQVAVLGGKQDAALAKIIASMVCEQLRDNAPLLNLVGALSLTESAAVVKKCRMLVANDSGLMHIAEAVGTPLLAVFGSTTRELGFFPHLPTSRVIEHESLSCRPCSHLGFQQCPAGHFRCMREITVEKVWNAVQEMMREA